MSAAFMPLTSFRRGAVRAVAVILSSILASLLAAACSGGSGPGGAAPASKGSARPTATGSTLAPAAGAWQAVTPGAAGLSAARLRQIAAQAERGHSDCLLVARYGKIAGEWYFRGTGRDSTQNVFSVTKSITSVLVGIAQDEGDLRISDSASKWIPEWKGTPAAAVTVRDLLSNDSGRQWSTKIDYAQLVRARDRTAFAVGLKQAQPPGTVWAYNNSAIQTLQRVLQNATGQDVATFARQRLFTPAGMSHTTMTPDAAGNAQMFQGVLSTCRDMARFGQLMLNRGRLGSTQIVSAAWVRQSTGTPSTKLNAAYGYLWWLNHRGVQAGPLAPVTLQQAESPATPKTRLVPGAPDDLYWAIGLGNQIVQVDPSSRTVVVRLGVPEVTPRPPTFGPAEASRIVTQAVIRH
ncbi:MAG: serine hydrolase domain-containing protein [Micromonosporaceae bacterium]